MMVKLENVRIRKRRLGARINGYGVSSPRILGFLYSGRFVGFIKHRVAIVVPMVAILMIAGFSGCLGQEERNLKGPCSFYPDREHLEEKWGSLANHSKENYDRVSLGVWTWGTFRHEDTDTPNYFIDWEAYPVESRPEMFSDLLCAARGKLLTNETQTPSVFMGTSQEIGQGFMDDLREEHLRQTGEQGVETSTGQTGCCYILFAGNYYGSECAGNHINREDGHLRSHCY